MNAETAETLFEVIVRGGGVIRVVFCAAWRNQRRVEMGMWLLSRSAVSDTSTYYQTDKVLCCYKKLEPNSRQDSCRKGF